MFFIQLKSICKDKNTSVSALLDALSMSRGNIARWKTGMNPKFETKLKIAKYLEVPVESFLSEEEIEDYYAFNGPSQELSREQDRIYTELTNYFGIKNKPTTVNGSELNEKLKILHQITSDFSPEEAQRLIDIAELIESARHSKSKN